MAQLNALGSFPTLTYTVKNTSGSDIAANIGVIADTYVAGQISVKLPTGSGTTHPFGITMEAIANGKTGRVMGGGIAVCVASGTLTAGGPVMLDSAGKVLAQTAGLYQTGVCMQDAVATDAVNVLLAFAKNA